MKRLSFSSLGALVLGCIVMQHAHAQFDNGPATLSVVKIQDDLVVIHNDAVPMEFGWQDFHVMMALDGL